MPENEIKKNSDETKNVEIENINTRAVFDHDDEDSTKSSALIRMGLHLITIGILMLGILDIVPRKLTIPIGAAFLLFTACWNGVVYYKSGRKIQAIFTFVICGILAVMLAIYFLLQSDLVK